MTITWLPDDAMGENQPDGTYTRAASYGAAMINACFFDELACYDTTEAQDERKRIIEIETRLMPALKSLGFFRFFTPAEWLTTNQQGRILMAVLYLKQNPGELSEHCLHLLLSIAGRKLAPELKEIILEVTGGQAKP